MEAVELRGEMTLLNSSLSLGEMTLLNSALSLSLMELFLAGTTLT